ncbi:MAG TPA: DUF3857 and transglutaminase domain-containing protein, partial [Candidatus Sulfotelmatobacter sp.]|nr:DUF3857 and transglutaminase domain-containing protein [Candidatus Sulfotelmatobacter sp.]
MFRAKLFSIALAITLLGLSYRLFAFDDWLPITPEDLKMTADPAHPADAIILYHEETADDMTRHHYVYKRVKILTEKGKDRANIEIPFDATFIGISDIRARTIAPDGTVTPFSGKAFTSTIVKAHGVKYKAKTFTLPNVQTGSIIEWKYIEYWENFVIAPRWVVQDDLFQKRAKFTFVPMIKPGHYIEDSRGEIKDRVGYALIGLPENTAIKTTANNRMELELKDIPAFQEEDFAPPSAVLKSRVNFYYATDKMAKPQEFWKGEGKYWTKEVDKYAAHSAAVALAVTQATSPSDTAEQKARKIYAYVHTIKNLNYTNEQGELEEILSKESKEKRGLDNVLSKREGYRDEIARLFLAMARTAGLPTYLMRVADRDEVFFQPGIPNPSQLTSELAIVVIDGKEVFVDPGIPLCPFGHVAWQHTSTQGIRQTADGGTALAKTPSASYKDAISKRVGRLTLNEDGSVKGKVGIAWAGEEALLHRLSGLKTDAAGKKKELEDELKALLPAGALVQLDAANGWDNAEAQLTANFSVEIPSYASSTGKRMLVP